MADDDVKSPSLTRLHWIRDELEPWMTRYFKKHRKYKSVLLAAAQYWADEADDAVHLSALASKQPVPDFFVAEWEEDTEEEDTIYIGWRNRPSWDDNGEAIRAFQAYCGEGGSQELPASDQAEVFALVTRTPTGPELTWLGRCIRPWLDLPQTALPGVMDGAPADRKPLDVVLPAQTLDAADVKCLEAIAADPFAEGPRRVWADMWLTRNDPRGAFMQQRHPSRDALLEKGEFWLGELNQCVPLGSAVFEYGSLAAADVAFDKDRLQLAESPWWLSVHTLRFSGQEVFTKQMRGLRHVSNLTVAGLLALKDFSGTQLLESLHVSLDLAELDALNALPLTSLRTLSLTLPAGAKLGKLKLPTSTWLKLEHVQISRRWVPTYEWDEEAGSGGDDDMPSLDELRAALPDVPRLSVSSADGSGLPAGWALSVTKGEDEVAWLRLARPGPSARRERLDAQLAGLPSSVKTVRCEPSRLWAPTSAFPVGKGRRAQVG